MQTAAFLASAIAAISVCTNIFLAYLLRNRRTNVSRDEDMRTRLYNLKHKIDETTLITVPPHHELWEYGFKSLEELREVAVKCYGQLEIAPDGQVSRSLKTAVREIFEDVKGLYQYRDSYAMFSKGEIIRSPEQLSQWSDLERARHALTVLQTDCRKNMPIIDEHLTRLY